MTLPERIVVDPGILVGKPVIRGTRIAVELVVDLLAQGWPEAEILRNYPGLSHEDVRACLAYASALIKAERVYPLVPPAARAMRLSGSARFRACTRWRTTGSRS